MTTSLTTHGALTEPSLNDHIGKGREGKGSGKGGVDLALATHLSVSTSAPEQVHAKTCKQCGETKPIDAFYACKRNKDGRAYQCIACRKAYLARTVELRRETMRRWRAANVEATKRHIQNFAPKAAVNARQQRLSRYGLTEADYASMLEAQGGLCAICGSESDHLSGKLVVDHCHDSGAVRGLLCNGCNLALGLMKDSPVRLLAAAGYLERASAESTC